MSEEIVKYTRFMFQLAGQHHEPFALDEDNHQGSYAMYTGWNTLEEAFASIKKLELGTYEIFEVEIHYRADLLPGTSDYPLMYISRRRLHPIRKLVVTIREELR